VSTVVVDLTRSDLLAFTTRWLTGWPRIWPTFTIMFLLVAAYVSYKHGIPQTPQNWLALFAAGLGGGSGALVFGLLFGMLGVVLQASKMPGMLGRHEYTFVADGLLERTDANETLIKWGGAHSLVRTDAFVQIEIAPGLAHILPRRAFNDHIVFEQFCSTAERLVRQPPNRVARGF
jgi:hypothetical protein